MSSGTSDAQPLDRRRQHRVRVHDGDLLGDVLVDRALDDAVLEDEDDVLAVRHEHQVVGVEAVQERGEVGVQVAAQPVRRGEARLLDQGAREGAASWSTWRREAMVASGSPSSRDGTGLSRHRAASILRYGE